MLRRLLLILLVALLVARPLVRGEDPGQLSDLSDPGSLSLALMAMVGFLGWAIWWLWSDQPELHVGPADAALLVLVLLYFVGSFWASYRRAGWLTAWEWLGLALTVFLVRQLAARPSDHAALFGVLLAVGAAVSAQAVYQVAYDLPRQAARAGHLELQDHIRIDLQNRQIKPWPEEVEVLTRQLERRQASGPFFHPSSLACLLVLLLPGMVGVVALCVRYQVANWQTGLAGLLAALAAGALLLTLAWSVVAAGVVVALFAGGWYWPARRGGARVGVALAAAAAGLLLWAMVGSGALDADRQRWSEAWPAAWQMLSPRAWAGVGPSQFGLFYPRYMAETAGAPVAAAGNAALDVWADLGLAGVAALALGGGLFVWALLRRRPPAEDAPVDLPPPEAVRWEYYLGGMLGLVLAFSLRVGTLPVGDLTAQTVSAAIGSMIWFAAFGLYERVASGVADRAGALTLGLAALAGALLLNPGFTFPSVIGPALTAAALVLAAVAPAPAEWLGRQRLAMLLALPVLVAGAFSYFAFVFYPASASTSAIRGAHIAGNTFFDDRTRATARKLQDPPTFVRDHIIKPLKTADDLERNNARTRTELAEWYGRLYSLTWLHPQAYDFAERALAWARQAQAVCPEGPWGYQVEYEIHFGIGSMLKARAAQMEKEAKADKKLPAAQKQRAQEAATHLRREAEKSFAAAAETMRQYLPRAPVEPQMRFQLAQALIEAGRPAEGREHAAEAHRLDELARRPRKLTYPQQTLLKGWLKEKAGK